ncbi:MAG: NUDIX protein, partial [Gammaproteobacteria bacterium]|nr:NUDIX protein [Gammaproteobacteria bacterium]
MRHKQSAGLMLFRRATAVTEVLLAHPGGPYWSDRHAGAWSIP